jgi:cytochrome b pre-mRNA-processing protein 3
MLDSLRTRADLRRKAGEIYGAVVTQARSEHFYAEQGVPDTPTGRYEMVTLHLVLVLERLRQAGSTSALPRLLAETFVVDMDDSLRELATGDLTVPKKIRRVAAGLYDRTMTYRAALESRDDAALTAALNAHVYDGTQNPHAAQLARYVRNAAASLAAIDIEKTLLAGSGFPHPGSSAGEAA